jgi:hypothetical protein
VLKPGPGDPGVDGYETASLIAFVRLAKAVKSTLLARRDQKKIEREERTTQITQLIHSTVALRCQSCSPGPSILNIQILFGALFEGQGAYWR